MSDFRNVWVPVAAVALLLTGAVNRGLAEDPVQGATRIVDLGDAVDLELVFIPAGEFKMGSTAEERAWATGIEGGATPGTDASPMKGSNRGRCALPTGSGWDGPRSAWGNSAASSMNRDM